MLKQLVLNYDLNNTKQSPNYQIDSNKLQSLQISKAKQVLSNATVKSFKYGNAYK